MYSIFESLLKARHCKFADVARKTGISLSTFTDWRAGRYTPKADKIAKIANFFGVSPEYIMTGNDSAPAPTYQITDFEYQLVLAYRKAGALQEAIDSILHLEKIKKEAYSTA